MGEHTQVVEADASQQQTHNPPVWSFAQRIWALIIVRTLWFTRTEKAAEQASSAVRPAQSSRSQLHQLIWRLKEWFIEIVGFVVPLIMTVLLGIGVGYFFADFRLPIWDVWVVFSYIGGMLVEITAVALLYLASQQFYKRKAGAFSFTIGLYSLFAVGTVMTQYLFASQQLTASGVIISNGAIAEVPWISFLFGIFATNGRAGMLVVRAILYHFVEIACIFLVARYEFEDGKVTPMQAARLVTEVPTQKSRKTTPRRAQTRRRGRPSSEHTPAQIEAPTAVQEPLLVEDASLVVTEVHTPLEEIAQPVARKRAARRTSVRKPKGEDGIRSPRTRKARTP